MPDIPDQPITNTFGMRGGVTGAIAAAAQQSGVDTQLLHSIAFHESGGNPNQTTGTHHGLFNLTKDEFAKYGPPGGSIWSAQDNAIAAANQMKDLQGRFQRDTGRAPTHGESYLMYQQGYEGAKALAANPNAPAWQTMKQFHATDQGAQKTIWRNLTPDAQRQFGSVQNVSGSQFVNFWSQQIGGPSSSDFGAGFF